MRDPPGVEEKGMGRRLVDVRATTKVEGGEWRRGEGRREGRPPRGASSASPASARGIIGLPLNAKGPAGAQHGPTEQALEHRN